MAGDLICFQKNILLCFQTWVLAAKQLQANESPFRIRKDLHIKEVAVPTYDLWWQCYFRNWNCNFLALAKAFTSYNLTNEHTTTRYHNPTK